MVRIQTSADPVALCPRARQLCYLGGHALQSSEIIGILKLKDDMPTDLADSLKVDEEDRKSDHAPLIQAKEDGVAAVTATIETNLRQGEAETEVDCMKGDLGETETESNEASSEWEEERQKSRADELGSRSLPRRSSPLSTRRFLWPSDSTDGSAQRKGSGWLAKNAGNSTGGRAHGKSVVFHSDSLMSSLPIVETQKSQRNVRGVDRRETDLFFSK